MRPSGLLAFGLVPLLLILGGASPPGANRSKEVNALRRDLLSKPSATGVLQAWCATHHLADPAQIVALRQREVEKAADGRIRRLLGAGPHETIIYRRVDLDCGRHALSRADNWYRPALLTPDMNRRLETTDAPFGLVAGPLNFHRQALDVRRLAGHDVLRLRARLITPEGTPFSLVSETYSDEIFGEAP